MAGRAEWRLAGPRGDNPLGFLSVLGAAAALEDAGAACRVRWEGVHAWLEFETMPGGADEMGFSCDGRVCGRGHATIYGDPGWLVWTLDRVLRRTMGGEEKLREAAGRLEETRRKIKDTEKKLKQKYAGRAQQQEQAAARRAEIGPLEEKERQLRREYMETLLRHAGDPVITLGRNLKATNEEFLGFIGLLSDAGRRSLDLAASFGVADPSKPGEEITSTPWALLTGAGHQNFLDTVRSLMSNCTACHYAQALAGPWIPRDVGLSLRLDPQDDRRYALMASDPTAAANKSVTLWGANRLAFEALRFFVGYPSTRGPAFVGWRPSNAGNWARDVDVRWPLWSPYLSPYEIRSLLLLPQIWDDERRARRDLLERGVHAVIASRRVQVDKYYNLAPGMPVWMT